MYLESPNKIFNIDIGGPTIPTNEMSLSVRLIYIIRKFFNFIWRYKKNPKYLFIYLCSIANKSYKEKAIFMDEEKFIEEAKKRSTLRLQDGEFTLLLGTRDIVDEQRNDKLIKMYREAISSYMDSSPYMLGLPPYIIIDNNILHKHAFKYLWMPAKILYRLWFPKKPSYFNGSYFYIDNKPVYLCRLVKR
jgi:hypothetical protein